jgi:hypothetical protein
MEQLVDSFGRKIRFTDERKRHIESDHPEMAGQLAKITETLSYPDVIVKSHTDSQAELFYKRYSGTPVGEKYLCAIVKTVDSDSFILTSYFTDTIKRGEKLWTKK